MLPLAFFVLPALQAPAPVPPVIEAKTLPGVAGPLVPHYPDPARGPGNSPMDMDLRARARRGVNIPAVALPDGSIQVADHIPDISGWRAYRIEVPAHGGFKARLHSTHEAWFVVKVFDRWGREGEGMLQNRMHTGNPEASYRNPKNAPSTVYIVVDTSETNLQGEAYTLAITRN